MKPTSKLRARILEHLMIGGALASTGCIVKDEPTPDGEEDGGLDGGWRDAARVRDVGFTRDAAWVIDVARAPDASAPTLACDELDTPCCVAFTMPMPSSGRCLDPRDGDDAAREISAATWAAGFDGCCCADVIDGPVPLDREACAYRVSAAGYCCAEGRPFYVAEVSRLAPVVARGDWA